MVFSRITIVVVKIEIVRPFNIFSLSVTEMSALVDRSIMTVSGVFNFLQGYLDKLTHTKFKMNPIPLNILMLVITAIIGGVTVAYVFVQSRIYNRKRVQTSTVASEVS